MKRLVLSVLTLSSCQLDWFDPPRRAQVERRPLVAEPMLKPNVMVLFDTSGSMQLPIDPQAPGCSLGCGSMPGEPCPSQCPTRLSEAQRALDTFFANSVDHLRVGLATYPADQRCGGPVSAQVNLPPATTDDVAQRPWLETSAQSARAAIQSVHAMGGTPTAAALRYAASIPELQDPLDRRDDYVLLVTDGLPNCNTSNPANVCTPNPVLCGTNASMVCPAQDAACVCTLKSCSNGAQCSLGCLDDEGTLAAVRDLHQRGIRTAVVAYGNDAQSDVSLSVMTALAREGGFSGLCADGACEVPFSAKASSDLSQALSSIATTAKASPCAFSVDGQQLDREKSEQLWVKVDGVGVLPGYDTWSYNSASGQLRFYGELCSQIQTTHPSLEFAASRVRFVP